nr:hypothetical protein [Paracoccus saliphilus]
MLLVTLGGSVETGIIAGVVVSGLLHLWPHRTRMLRSSAKCRARSTSIVLRHQLICRSDMLGLRIDESLFFANARAIKNIIQRQVADRPRLPCRTQLRSRQQH